MNDHLAELEATIETYIDADEYADDEATAGVRAALAELVEISRVQGEAVDAVVASWAGYRDYNPPDSVIEEQRGSQRGAVLLCCRAAALAASGVKGASALAVIPPVGPP